MGVWVAVQSVCMVVACLWVAVWGGRQKCIMCRGSHRLRADRNLDQEDYEIHKVPTGSDSTRLSILPHPIGQTAIDRSQSGRRHPSSAEHTAPTARTPSHRQASREAPTCCHAIRRSFSCKRQPLPCHRPVTSNVQSSKGVKLISAACSGNIQQGIEIGSKPAPYTASITP